MYVRLIIEKPIWNTKSIGIAQRRLVPGTTMAIEIAYEDTEGNLVYPGTHTMPASKIRTYPTQTVKGGTILHIVPISDFDIIEE